MSNVVYYLYFKYLPSFIKDINKWSNIFWSLTDVEFYECEYILTKIK